MGRAEAGRNLEDIAGQSLPEKPKFRIVRPEEGDAAMVEVSEATEVVRPEELEMPPDSVDAKRVAKQKEDVIVFLDELNFWRKNEMGPGAVARLEPKVAAKLQALNAGIAVLPDIVSESWGRAAEVVLDQTLLKDIDGQDLVRQLNLAQTEAKQVEADFVKQAKARAAVEAA